MEQYLACLRLPVEVAAPQVSQVPASSVTTRIVIKRLLGGKGFPEAERHIGTPTRSLHEECALRT
ncbi:hypothetical protein Lesp02_40510 [Lentzea sp. NBRC 105346]|nr:hypothetical protein Lesp02_40510 [Lentzea sp. NBRC 105346]